MSSLSALPELPPAPPGPRRSALLATGLTDGAANAVLDRLTGVVSRLLRVPVSVVSLIDEQRQYFPGATGLSGWPGAERGTPLSYSICRFVVEAGDPFVVDDARVDRRTAGHPAVAELGVVAYAGVPLRAADGSTIGALCAIAPEPVRWTQAQVGLLEDLADAAVSEVELCTARRALEAARERGEAAAAAAHAFESTCRQLETRLADQASHDGLTGLANRALLRRRALAALANADEGAGPAVLLVDLDEFKRVNESLGHAVGDALLSRVAERLLDATRGSDTVARLGDDEFAILLATVRSPGEAELVAERVLQSLAHPLPAGGRDIRVSASIGIARGAGEGDPDALLRNADLALHRAKELGRGRAVVYEPAMHRAAVERLELEGELRRAVMDGRLTLHYQPIMELATGRVRGAEALVRWPHPTRGLVPPDQFIPLAERTDLIQPLGRWVLDEACRAAVTWPSEPDDEAGNTPSAPVVAVNVSGRQLQRPGFVQDVAEALSASGLPAGRLVLEVTESVLLADLDRALLRLEALRALGVQLALDDFGTGYSSLAYLQRLPVDVLKVDRSFTAEVLTHPKRAAVVRAVVDLAGTLGLRVVAEGIETVEQQAALRAMECAYGQGYHFARPLPDSALRDFLAARQAGPRQQDPTPAHAAGAAPGTPAATVPPPATSAAPLVLVADDDAQVRSLIARTLTGAGFAVLQAVDGADALRHLGAAGAAGGEVALVITDMGMPELDGAALARALARCAPALPVLVVSGEAPDPCLATLPNRACVDFLSKPFTRAALLDAAHGLLARAGAPSGSAGPR